MGDLSAHFSAREFISPPDGHRMDPPMALLLVLERIRALSGEPLHIVSGHRCCAHNAAVGGAPQSRHIAGDAADIPAGRCTTTEAAKCGATGIGSRNGWAVHVDVRPGPHVRWEYPSVQLELDDDHSRRGDATPSLSC